MAISHGKIGEGGSRAMAPCTRSVHGCPNERTKRSRAPLFISRSRPRSSLSPGGASPAGPFPAPPRNTAEVPPEGRQEGPGRPGPARHLPFPKEDHPQPVHSQRRPGTRRKSRPKGVKKVRVDRQPHPRLTLVARGQFHEALLLLPGGGPPLLFVHAFY